jgi:DNA-binding transcriptional LysR family regulator
MSLRLEFYNSFIAVCQEKSFSKAARRVGLSQGAISQHIAALERVYGMKLLKRGAKEIALTSAGDLVLKRAYEILAIERLIRQDIDKTMNPVQNTIKIAASTIPGEHLLPTMIKGFRSIRPDADLRVSIVDSQKAWRQLKDNEVDFAAVGTSTSNLEAYEVIELATEELVLVVATDDALASKTNVSVKEILKHPFISREAGSGTRKEIEAMLRRAGLSWSEFNVVTQLGSTEAVIGAVQQGIGASIVSSIAAEKAAVNKLIRIIHLNDLDTKRGLFLVRRKGDGSKKRRSRDLCGEFWRFAVSKRPFSSS